MEGFCSRNKPSAAGRAKILIAMQKVVVDQGFNHRVSWIPKAECRCRGEIANNLILIYDQDSHEAWRTLLHEILELKMKRVTGFYRGLVNCLISFIEERVYSEKEEFLNSISFLVESVNHSEIEKT